MMLKYQRTAWYCVMLEHQHDLIIGASRDDSMIRTIQVFSDKLRGLGVLVGDRMLDVGCGYGDFTRIFASGFKEVYGIDIQQPCLERFRREANNDPKYSIHHMSASAMSFPDDFFDTIITIETLEHVPDLIGAAREIIRVMRPGGELLITVPNRWCPSENHGIEINGRFLGRAPLLTYWPWLHRRLAIARVFTVRDLDFLFAARGLRRCAVDYAWPTFEHAGNPLQRFIKPFYGLMRQLERSPIRIFGTSVLVKYVKPPLPPSSSAASKVNLA